MTQNELIELEREGLIALEKGEHRRAVHAFERLLQARPDYEHGMPHYHLARAFENIGDYPSAAEQFKAAVSWDQNDPIRLGGYASFLYLHGRPSDAFELHLKLAKLERSIRRDADISDIRQILLELGNKMGLTESDAKQRITQEGLAA